MAFGRIYLTNNRLTLMEAVDLADKLNVACAKGVKRFQQQVINEKD